MVWCLCWLQALSTAAENAFEVEGTLRVNKYCYPTKHLNISLQQQSPTYSRGMLERLNGNQNQGAIYQGHICKD